MRNGYFQLVKTEDGFGVKLFPPKDGGEAVQLAELMNYLDSHQIEYEVKTLKEALGGDGDQVVPLGSTECPAVAESYRLQVDSDAMRAVARFYPASETGERMSQEEFVKDLRYKGIKFGVQQKLLQTFFQSAGVYCMDLVVAKGQPPRQGEDARIEYYFNTDIHAKPAVKEDGSVDYFHLDMLIPEDPGDFGCNIMGSRIKPREVRKATLRYGKNIQLSEDRMTLTSMVNGHVTLVDGNVFVSNVYEVENVDTSTGNIDFDGSVQVNGNVASNFSVKAKGNVIINGVVEGAYIEAGEDIIIARGMNGMGKGVLKAGRNIVAKFLENATAEADGYVSTDSILHSRVSAGTEITVTGKRGFITGGHVQADEKIDVKTLGAVMGASTVVEVGVNPKLKNQYQRLQKEIGEIVRDIRGAQPILANFTQKKAKGARFNEDQLKYIRETAQLLEAKKAELEQKNSEMKQLQENFSPDKKSSVLVRGEVYPGTTIIIGDVSMVVQSNVKYCRFEKVDGDVKMLPL